MNIQNWQRLLAWFLLIVPLVILSESTLATPFLKTDSFSAVKSLLDNAKTYYETKQYEQAAASLERAIRITSRNPILWHDLAGVRLAQEDWKRAANLAQKSNSLAGKSKMHRKLRVRNWVIITLACEGMDNQTCASDARNRAQTLVQKGK